MAVLTGIYVVDSLVVYPVYPDLAGCVNDLLFGHEDANMCDHAFFIIEEHEVAGPGVANKIDCFALQGLLG